MVQLPDGSVGPELSTCNTTTSTTTTRIAKAWSPIIRYFAFEHLPPSLRAVSQPIALLARELDIELPDGPEKSAGLRKLLEAKDCFVRAALG